MFSALPDIDIADPALQGLLDTLRPMYLVTDRDDRLRAAFHLLRGSGFSLSDAHGRNQEGRMLLVVGETGTSKTSAIKRLARAEFGEGAGKAPSPFLSVVLPSQFNVTKLGDRILTACQYQLARMPKPNDMLRKVDGQLRNLRPQIIHFDEFQRIRSVSKTFHSTYEEVLRDAMNYVMLFLADGFNLLISGPPEIEGLFDPGYLKRRATRVEFERVVATGHVIEDLTEAIASYCRVARIQVFGDEAIDAVPRLIHAASGGQGLALEVGKAAVFYAAWKGKSRLGLDDFADYFHDVTGASFSENPFLVSDWRALPDTLVATVRALKEREDPPSAKKTERRF
ncbi:AAA family ATPase [Mesorhizobium sp. RIZ17]|uniref:AAA family ATPase n=1 Tax=Mesorhizobium sp. RIZ17 TaxID=3132743 RepID=UPI003DA7DC68